MFSNKLISGLVGILFSLNFGLYGTAGNLPGNSDIHNSDTRLSNCLNLIHRYHAHSLVAIKRDELAKTKRVTTDVFLTGLAISEDHLNDSLNTKIQEIIKSGNSEQKEAAITSISYLMFDYKSDIEISLCDINKVCFDRVSKLFLSEQKLFLKLCIDLINNVDTDTNVRRACYEFFIQYFFKSECGFDSVDLDLVIETGLEDPDRFIKICALALNLRAESILSNIGFARIKSNFNTTDFLIKIRSIIRKSRFCGCASTSNNLQENINFLKNLRALKGRNRDIGSTDPQCLNILSCYNK